MKEPYVPDLTERFPEGESTDFDRDIPIEYDPRAEEADCDIYGTCSGTNCKWFIKCKLQEKICS